MENFKGKTPTLVGLLLQYRTIVNIQQNISNELDASFSPEKIRSLPAVRAKQALLVS